MFSKDGDLSKIFSHFEFQSLKIFLVKFQNFKLLWLIFLLIPFYALNFAPLLEAGFVGDDIYSVLIKAELQLSNTGLWKFITDDFVGWMVNGGRIFPLAIIAEHVFFYVFHEQASYQLARVIFIFLSLAACAWLVKLLTKSWEVGLLFLFLIPLFWSVQNFCDPLTSYGILLPLVTAYLRDCFWIRLNPNL
jgi:hypothetical protein